MFGEEKNLKDLKISVIKDTPPVPAQYEAKGFNVGFYTKTDKLITALYMVTDILDKNEPIRTKLRTLATGIISDTHSTPTNIQSKISQIMSFLDIASAVNIISEMNCNILRKEFSLLDQSVKEFYGNTGTVNRRVNIEEFFREELPVSIGQQNHTRIGVQKGSTLMSAIKKMSNIKPSPSVTGGFDNLKRQRRDNILNIIKIIGDNATIKDIKDKIPTVSEKTLQRELMSMVKDNVLNKVGEKRWSRYFVKIKS